MRILIVGGSRFIGRQLAQRLVVRGDDVTLLNRGTRDDGLKDSVRRIVVDRKTNAFAQAWASFHFDAVVDFVVYTGADVRASMEALRGRCSHYVFVSTGQVYFGAQQLCAERACPDAPPARPDEPLAAATWDYAIGKFAAEKALEADPSFVSTRVRLSIVHGFADPEERIATAVRRFLKGRGPLFVPFSDAIVRHAYAPEVARIVARILGDRRTFGRAYNISPTSSYAVMQVYEKIAAHLGATAELVAIQDDAPEQSQLSDLERTTLGGRGMSVLDATRLCDELGLEHAEMDNWLGGIIDSVAAP